jgi:hypothetical protein
MEIQVLPEPNYPVSPEQFIGRKTSSEAFTLALQQGLAAGRISSFAVLGDWGIGKSSLLLKFAAICSDPKYVILPVLVPVSTDYGDYPLCRKPARIGRSPIRDIFANNAPTY